MEDTISLAELTPEEHEQFVRLFQKKHPEFEFGHVQIKQQNWKIATWDQSEFDSVTSIKYGKDGNMIEKMDKLWLEIAEDSINQKHTTIFPKQHVIEPNILLLVGLTESSKRDTNFSPQNTTGVQFIGFGTGSTAESESQTGLITAYGSRLDLDVKGQRSTVNQTSKYNVSATDADLTVPVTLKEAVLYNAVTAGVGHARIQFPDFPLTAGDRITIQINELMRNL